MEATHAKLYLVGAKAVPSAAFTVSVIRSPLQIAEPSGVTVAAEDVTAMVGITCTSTTLVTSR